MAGLKSFSGTVTTANLLVSVPVPWVKLIETIGTAFSGVNLNSYKSFAFLSGYSIKIATDLPASVGDPPPIAITAFAPKSSAIFTASFTC